jgi:protein-tyrosine phosphatase
MLPHPTSVLFVCLGNICRSPAAEEVFRTIVREAGAEARYHIDSAGTYGGHSGSLPDPRMQAHAARRGYELTHHARRIRPADFEEADIILAMDDANYDDLRDQAPDLEAQQKVHRMTDYCRHLCLDAVPDPYYTGASGFELVLDLLEDACRGLFEALENRKNVLY